VGGGNQGSRIKGFLVKLSELVVLKLLKHIKYVCKVFVYCSLVVILCNVPLLMFVCTLHVLFIYVVVGMRNLYIIYIYIYIYIYIIVYIINVFTCFSSVFRFAFFFFSFRLFLIFFFNVLFMFNLYHPRSALAYIIRLKIFFTEIYQQKLNKFHSKYIMYA